MSLAISGSIAVILLFMHRYFTNVRGSSDVLTGVASAMFWLLFAGAGWVTSAGDVTDIYFYFFFFGLGMFFAVLISALNFHPTQEANQEPQSGKDSEESGMAGMRKRHGWKPIRR